MSDEKAEGWVRRRVAELEAEAAEAAEAAKAAQTPRKPPPPPPPPRKPPLNTVGAPPATSEEAVQAHLPKDNDSVDSSNDEPAGIPITVSPMGPASSTDVEKNTILPMLVAYFNALEGVTQDENSESYKVREQLKATIKVIDSSYDFTEKCSASPTAVVGNSGVSRQEIKKPTTPEEHLALLQELEVKLGDILQEHPTDISKPVSESLKVLQDVVRESIESLSDELDNRSSFGM